MNTIPIPLNNFLDEGVYIGNLYDFVKKDEIDYLKNLINQIKQYSNEERNNRLYCIYDYNLIKNENIDENIEFIHNIKFSEIANRDLFVKENNRIISQKWFSFYGVNEDCKFFNKISKRILDLIYPNIEISYDTSIGFSLYEDDHFILEHRDGKNEKRVCALIIYLSNETEYVDGGGELVIETNSNKIYSIKPILGTFSLLDFTKNNIKHSVNKVKNGFKRYSFLNFFIEKTNKLI